MGVQSFADGTSRNERRDQIRAMQRELAQGRAKWPAKLAHVPMSEWPTKRDGPTPVVQVMRSRDFLVQIYDETTRGGWMRMSVTRTHIDSTGEWLDGITWDQLQRIKSEAGFGEHEAFEIFPRDRDIVNVAAIRHLWVLHSADQLPLTWRKE